MAVTITIAGTDRSSSVVFGPGTPRMVDNINQKTDTFEFKVRKVRPTDHVPELGQEVVVERDGTTIFGGVIVRILEQPERSPLVLEYAITCADYAQYLKRELVTERYENMTVAAIIEALVADYTSDGFTTTNVVGTQTIASIAFNRITVSDCLQKLADALAYVWYVDYDKDIHFFPKNTETGPALTDTSGNYIATSLVIEEDLSQLRNVVVVQGGERISETARTEVFSGDGTKDTFALANRYDSVPAVEVGGVPQTVGIEFLDSDASFDCMWSFQEKSLRFTAGNVPASGTNNIVVSGTYLYPIVVNVMSKASIAEFGRYEFAITDKSIRSQDEAVTRALAELASYQAELQEGSFRTYEDGFRSGQVITITSALRQKSLSVVVQSVRAGMRDPNGESFEYLVTFATLKTVGIIDYLQTELRSREVIIDESETILSFIDLADTVATSDTLDAPLATTGPYQWGSCHWGYFTWG